MFVQYQHEFNAVTSEIKAKLERLTGYSDNPMHQKDQREAVGRVEELLKQACDLAKQIDLEVRSTDDANQRRILAERAKPVKATVKELQARFREANDKLEREGLLGAEATSKAGVHRGRMVDANERARQQTSIIRDAIDTARDTEHVALDITNELQRNRETLQSIRGHVADTSNTLGVAGTMMQSMQKRESQQKVVIIGVALLLTASISALIYWSFG